MRINPFYLHGEELTPVRKLLALKALAGGAPLSEYTETGNPVSFETNIAKPLSVVAAFAPVQAGSGDPSPENVRPITGWTGAKVTRSGRNLLDPELFETSNNSYVKYETGELQRWSSAYRASDYVPIIAGFQYTLYAVMWGQNSAGTAFYDSEKQYISGFKMNSKTQTEYTFTAPEGAAYMRFCATDDTIGFDDVFLVYGDTAGTFEEYVTPQSVSVTFPAEAGTVYGGTLDLTTGVLTVGWLWVYVTGTTALYGGGASYNEQTGTNRFAYLSNAIGAFAAGGYSDMMKRVNHSTWDNPDNDLWNFYINAGNQLHMVFENETVDITSEMSASDRTAAIKTWLAENPITFVLPLVTPIEYQLSGTEILSLIGNNVLWSDLNGNLTVVYKKKGS